MPRRPIHITPTNPSRWYKRNVRKWEAAANTRDCPACNAPVSVWCYNLRDLDEPIITMHRERLK